MVTVELERKWYYSISIHEVRMSHTRWDRKEDEGLTKLNIVSVKNNPTYKRGLSYVKH